MAATPQPQWTYRPADRWGPGRVIALVLAGTYYGQRVESAQRVLVPA